MKFKEWVAKQLYKRLFTYMELDNQEIKPRMEKAILNYYLDVDSPSREEEVHEVLNYKTRLFAAGTVETLTICGANLGFNQAIRDPNVLEVATTIRLAFGLGDIMDTDNDEYDPNVLAFKKLDEKTLQEKLHKHEIYRNIVNNLDNLIVERFKKFHPSSLQIYLSEKEKVLQGQQSDIEDHFYYLQGDFEKLREKHPDYQSCMELLVKKLGLMGGCAAHVAYLESGGKNETLKELESEFFTNAGVLLQFWANDVQKIEKDIENLETNPIITTAICRFKDVKEINKKLVRRLLEEEPQILDMMASPYQQKMEKALNGIKKFNFDPRTHQGLALMVKTQAKKEKANFLKKFGFI
ncbi:MAG: hypothetical protein NZ942_01525 [Candidatus Aenigmarchaeota archaeon]|nr:hypothetical protein [Candidatus Aenigmarchaeota archaeon]